MPSSPIDDKIIAMHVGGIKIREDAVVRSKAVYLALGILPDGTRDVLGIWIEQTAGAMFWLRVFNDRKPRGVNDILIFVVDGLKGLAEAIETALPQTTVQTCIVHLICNSISYASLKDRKAGVSKALRPIVRHRPWRPPWRRWRRLPPAPGAHKCQTIAPAWQRAWSHMIPFFAFSPGGAARDLYHQRDRELARSAQEEAMNQFAIIYGDRFTQVAV